MKDLGGSQRAVSGIDSSWRLMQKVVTAFHVLSPTALYEPQNSTSTLYDDPQLPRQVRVSGRNGRAPTLLEKLKWTRGDLELRDQIDGARQAHSASPKLQPHSFQP